MENLSIEDQDNLRRDASVLNGLRIPVSSFGTLAERLSKRATLDQIRDSIGKNRRSEATRRQPGKSGGLARTVEERYDDLMGRVIVGRNDPIGRRIGQREPLESLYDRSRRIARNGREARYVDDALRDLDVDVNMAAKGGKTKKRIKRDPRALRRKKAIGRKK